MAYLRLHVQQADGQLPMVCMRCGEPATVVKTKKMSWFPRWVFWLILVHVLIFGIVALIATRRARLQAPFCEQHQGHWPFRQILLGLSLVGIVLYGIIVVVFFLNAPQRNADLFGPFILVGSVVLVVGWLIGFTILQNTGIRAAEITKTHMLLAGVSEAFVQAVEEAEIERRVRLRQWENEDAEPAPRIWHSPEHIQEDFPPRPGLPPDAFRK